MKNVVVFTTWDEPLADMAMNFLRAEGISAVKTGEVPRSVLPFTIDGLGQIAIRVPEAEAGQAREIIAVRFSEEDLDEFPLSDDESVNPEPPGSETTS